ncbi:hypothetical protein CPC08DRAFT_721561 [Agrocybe pediades]|nr:hypothetical protein CPC08DRAFT_721561 [Agrocybe pediades]
MSTQGEKSYSKLIRDLQSKEFFEIRLSKKLKEDLKYEFWQNISSGIVTNNVFASEDFHADYPQQLTSKVYYVTASHGAHSFSKKLVIKIAEGKRQYEELVFQLCFHQRFAKDNFFGLRSFGIFRMVGADPWFCAMVMENAGPIYNRSAKYCKDNKLHFLHALKEIHSTGIAHGNLQRDHLLMNIDGKVAIVGCKDGGKEGADSELRELCVEEIKLLERWLPLP